MNTLAASTLSPRQITDLECLRGFLVTWSNVQVEEAEMRALGQIVGAGESEALPARPNMRLPVAPPKRPPQVRRHKTST